MPIIRGRRRNHRPYFALPRVLCSDSFTRADGAVGSFDNLLGGSGIARAWTVASGAWAIASNKLRCTTAGNIVCDAGVKNYRTQATFVDSADGQSLIGRWVDNNNYWRVLIDATTMLIQQVVAGSVTAVSSTSLTPSAGDRLQAEFLPGMITAFHPRTGKRLVYASTLHILGTGCGIRSGVNTRNFDDFYLTAL